MMLEIGVTEAVAVLRCRARIVGWLVVAGVSLAGCGTSTGERALSGAGIGAGAGIVSGALFGIPVAGAAIGAVAGAGVGAATTPPAETAVGPPRPAPPPEADHVVTTYVSDARGPTAARLENRKVATRTCGNGFVLIDERSGTDSGGKWLQLVYGCLAEDRPKEQTSGR